MIKVSQVTIGRFHHFHLARQFERYGMLKEIWTGYPKFKLSDENGIPKKKLNTFPWIYAPYVALARGSNFGIVQGLRVELAYWAQLTLDRHVAKRLKEPTVLLALSGSGLASGARAQALGGFHICDRGSTHIRFQNRLLQEEYARWGLQFDGVDPRMLDREEAEYEQADLITVPSGFVERSFLSMGVPASRIRRIPYGARLERFFPQGKPQPASFTVLFVGQVSLRKGILYLLEAFARFKHPNKRLKIVGAVAPEMETLLRKHPLEGVEFLGLISNSKLPDLYSKADVFVLPSVEEGLAMVMGEALACGCPVIATENTGAEDLFTDGAEGFIVPSRSSLDLALALEKVADSNGSLRKPARKRVDILGGWDSYGENMQGIIAGLGDRRVQ